MKKSLLSATFLARTTIGLMMATQSGFAASLVPEKLAAPSTTIEAKAVVEPEASAPDAVELAALYYYAKEGQMERVEREKKRLSLKFPGFVEPEDLFQPEPEFSVDETPLWQLYDADDFAGIEAAVTQLALDNPGWQPSQDFRDKLARRKLRFDMTTAESAGDTAQVMALGKALDPQTEMEVDLLWTLIAACRSQGQTEAMVPVYQGILFRKPGTELPDDVVMTTLQMAVQDFPAKELRKVIALLSEKPELADRMKDLTLDLVRRDIADFAADAAGVAETPAPEAVLAVRRSADLGHNGADQTLLGWYYLKLDRLDDAETWFRKAFDGKPQIESLKGLTLSLDRANKRDQAFLLVSSHLDLLGDKADTFLDILSYPFQTASEATIDPKLAELYAKAIQSSQSADHAVLIGWYAYNGRQFEAAKAWFAKSAEWKVGEDSVKGMALSAVQMKDTGEVEALKTRFGATYPQVFAELKKAVAPKGGSTGTVGEPAHDNQARYVVSFRNKRYGDCLADLERIAARGNLSAEAQLIRGWCHLELNHLAEARDAFQFALAGNVAKGDDALYGLGLSLLRAHMTGDLEALLASRPLSEARAKELRAEMLWQKAESAFNTKDYEVTLANLNARLEIAPEPVGMTQMRAWAHYHLGNLKQSRAIFAELNQIVDDPANRRGLAAIQDRMGIKP